MQYPPLSVYIHIPWCIHKCPYCDFNSHELKDQNIKNNEEAYYGVGASLDILDTIDIYVEYIVFDTSVNSEIAGVGIKFSF